MSRFNPNSSTLAGVAPSTLQTWLAQAQQAMADLSTGAKVASLDISAGPSRRTVTYTKADMGALTQWIKLLQAQLGIIRAPRRAFPVSFA